MKSALQTPLLLDDIRFDSPPLGWVSNIKFEDWDLADSEKFPQLAAEKLRQQKWLQSVEKLGLLHLRWIPHYHRVPITIFVIRKLLCLVHDRYLWLEGSIPITNKLIHWISWLSIKGSNPADIAEKSSDLGLAEDMKAKYKLEKKKWGYVIESIKYRGVRISTQFLASKLMRKCHVDEVLTSVIALVEQCAERVQFKWV